MFTKVSPESVGISSKSVLDYLSYIKSRELSTHGIIASRGDKIFLEAYAEPFSREKAHRMYSQTKSYVGIAICLLAYEGKLSLDDKIVDFFPESLPEVVHPYLKAQTVRNMLEMQTCFFTGFNWFVCHNGDRVKTYFSQKVQRYPGCGYSYDSQGSFVLGALVEKLTGKKFLDYLREKCLDEIGFSKEARVLTAPGGYSWGDSALLARPVDMLLFIRLLANGGMWNGKRLLPEKAVKDACAVHSANFKGGTKLFNGCGYGYQIWTFYDGSIAFNGMHDQVTFYNPATDIAYTVTSCNEDTMGREALVGGFFEKVIKNAENSALPEDKNAYEMLLKAESELELPFVLGESTSPYAANIHGKRFVCEDNPCKISEFTFKFENDCGKFIYKNEQGDKVLDFGIGKNVFSQFPQFGYSDEVGGVPCEGHTYLCAASGAWVSDSQFNIRVQIVDDYLGALHILCGFNGEHAFVSMVKNAEAFLNEYNGEISAKIE